ncbi:MAG: ribosomal protein S18-alanine N-acetyltransferase [Anaerolinea sp.]|nr:ribosomal protein S18-alanine N-acetyltransferase [Anaerolinea sp.]
MAGIERVVVRRMELADVEAVHQIDTLSFSLPWPERSFRFELLENPLSRAWVAVVGEEKQIAAMMVLWLIVDEAHIGTLATHPNFRRLGLGARLLAHGLLAAREEGAQQSFLEVRRGNLAAQALYQRFGYEVTAVRARYYRDNGEDALLMTLADLQSEACRVRLTAFL